MPYDENSIKILSAGEVDRRFGWMKAERVAADNSLPVEWIKRGFEACYRLGVNPALFVDKYIHGLEVQLPPEFEAVYKEIVREDRYRLQVGSKLPDKTA
ncbi:hypothetical protein KS886_000330 [Escherichia coli]|nr:hypothetical protein [Escherichia coli]